MLTLATALADRYLIDTAFEAICHPVEHFSLPLKQIIVGTTMRAPGSIQFYGDVGGLPRPSWPPLSQDTTV